jgi:hypothetical protein
MIEITYRYDPEHIRTYQALASRRVEAKDSDFASEWWSWMLAYTLVAGAMLAAANLAFPVLTGRPFGALEFVCGFVGGWACVYALSWRRYRRLSSKMVKPDGPTMSEQRVSVVEDGIKSNGRFVDHLYRCTAFEGVTVHDGIIVLWTEPGDGAIVPRSAFADQPPRRRFSMPSAPIWLPQSPAPLEAWALTSRST